MSEKPAVWSVELGRMEYSEAFELQRRVAALVASGHLPDVWLTVEHPAVYTLGANFHAENLPLPEAEVRRLGVDIQRTDRGGDITYHGPNQLVAYPIFNLERYGKDLHKWLREIEETVIVLLGEFGLEGRRFPPHTGVWVGERKVCALGIKVKRWTSIHGLALNCNNDLAPFSWIIPCGIKGYAVTSLSKEIGRDVPMAEARPVLERAFAKVFGVSMESVEKDRLLAEVDRLERHAANNAPA